MTEQQYTPELRFPEFDDEWQEYQLGKNAIIKGRLGWKGLKQNEYIDNGYAYLIANKHIKNGYIDWKGTDQINQFRYEESPEIALKKNDIIFSKDGALGNPAIINKLPKPATINSTMMLVRFNSNYISSIFFYQILLGPSFSKLIHLKVSGSSIPHLFQADMKEFKFYAPTIIEQNKIGKFFSKLDRQIELEEEKLELLEQQKRGYMQKVFSQELRFKDKKDNYYSDWKNYQLKDLTYYKNGKGYEKVATTNGKYNIINLNSIGVKGQLKDSGKYTDFEDDTLLKNDLIMILSDVAKGNLIGMTAIIDENNKYLLNQRIALLRIKNSLITNAYFLYLYINFNRKYFINMSIGMSQLNINKKTVEDFQVNLPSIEEQNKITILFKNYEDTIKKQASKVKLLKQRKQGLLQKMFV